MSRIWKGPAFNVPFAAVVALGGGGCVNLNEILETLPDAPPPLAESRVEALAGSYALVSFAGQPLPYQADIQGEHPCPGGGVAISQEIAEGRLIVARSGRVEVDSDAVVTCRMPSGELRADTLPQQVGGMLRQGEGALLIQTRQGEPLRLVWNTSDSEVRAPQIGASWTRVPTHATASATPREHQTAGTPETTANAATAYLPAQCQGQEELEGLPEIPAADTVGLGVPITAAFPGWKVATEAEIGCSAFLSNWTPAFWSDFRSGGAWWVKEGDVTGDGREDSLLYISNVEDGLSVKAVLLTAAGESVEVSHVHGRIVGMNKSGTVGGCPRSVDGGMDAYETREYPHATIGVSNNMNWSYTLVWHDGELKDQSEVTGLGPCH